MNIRKLSVGEYGWLGLVTYVLAVDSHAWRREDDTMSMAFGRWIQSHEGRAACVSVWGVITAHLFWSVPLPGQARFKKVMVRDRRNIRVENIRVKIIDPPP